MSIILWDLYNSIYSLLLMADAVKIVAPNPLILPKEKRVCQPHV